MPIIFFPTSADSPGVRISPRCRSLLPGIPAGELTSPVGLICITVTSSFELVVVILQSEGDGNTVEKQRRTGVPLAAVPPPKCIAGGSSDTHNNHNNGISRVTRGPPPRIGTAHGTASVTPSTGTIHQAGEPSRRVVLPSSVRRGHYAARLRTVRVQVQVFASSSNRATCTTTLPSREKRVNPTTFSETLNPCGIWIVVRSADCEGILLRDRNARANRQKRKRPGSNDRHLLRRNRSQRVGEKLVFVDQGVIREFKACSCVRRFVRPISTWP